MPLSVWYISTLKGLDINMLVCTNIYFNDELIIRRPLVEYTNYFRFLILDTDDMKLETHNYEYLLSAFKSGLEIENLKYDGEISIVDGKILNFYGEKLLENKGYFQHSDFMVVSEEASSETYKNLGGWHIWYNNFYYHIHRCGVKSYAGLVIYINGVDFLSCYSHFDYRDMGTFGKTTVKGVPALYLLLPCSVGIVDETFEVIISSRGTARMIKDGNIDERKIARGVPMSLYDFRRKMVGLL